MRSSFLIALASFAVPALGRQYNIRNWCPSSINVYLAGRALRTNVTSGSVFSVNLTDDEAYFYTDANRKSFSSNGTRVGFKLEKPYGYYYMVVDPNNFNVGLSVEPDSPPAGNNNGRCAGVGCLAAVCTNSFNNNQEPTNLASLPTSSPPPSPLQSCLSDDTSYTITFCPAERWPPTSLALRPNGNSEWCLDVQGAKFENGTPVQLYKCNGTPAQQWVYNGFSTKVKLAGTNFCLDAGSNPGNGVGMKIWQCYDNLPAQSWYYTDDARLALEGKGQCLDLASGTKANGALVQTWQCTDNNNNQVWTP